MDKLSFANGLTTWNGPDLAKPRKWFQFVALTFLIFFVIIFPLAATAQPASSDTAIETARQWLTLADTQKVGQMWEQSDALMKSKSEQSAWIKYVSDMRTRLGAAPTHRIWQSMEHQINNPTLPQGEFISVTFVSDYPTAPAWERVSMVWKDDRWAPVGYQSGAANAVAQSQ